MGNAFCPSLQVSFLYCLSSSLKKGLSRLTTHVPLLSCSNAFSVDVLQGVYNEGYTLFFTCSHQTTIIRHTDNHQTKHHTTHTNHALPRCIAVPCACAHHRYGCQPLHTSSGSSQASDPSSTAINTSIPEQAARRIQSTRQALRTYEAPTSNPCIL